MASKIEAPVKKAAVPAKKAAAQPAKSPAKSPAKAPAKSTAKSAVKTAAHPVKNSTSVAKSAMSSVRKTTMNPPKTAAKTAAKTPVKAAAKKVVAEKVTSVRTAPAKKIAAPPAKTPVKKASVPTKEAKSAPAKAAPATNAAAAGPAPAIKKAAPPARRAAPPAAPALTLAPVRGETKDGIKYTKDFDAKFLTSQHHLLVDARVSLTGQAVRLEDEANSLIDDEMGDVQFDDESGEGDTMVVERERDLFLSARARHDIQEIDDALKRLKAGTYGYSVISFKPIPRERLEAIPWATELTEEKVGGIGRR